MVTNIIDCLLEYKSSMDYRGLNFDGDNARQNCTKRQALLSLGLLLLFLCLRNLLMYPRQLYVVVVAVVGKPLFHTV